MPHEIDLLLSCTHVTVERIEAAIFVPLVGEPRPCQKCKKYVTIARVGHPYWVDDDKEDQPTQRTNLKK